MQLKGLLTIQALHILRLRLSLRPRGERTICGLRKITFWLSFVIATLAIVVVGVAVGLGVGLSKDNSKNPHSSSTAISTNNPPSPTINSTPRNLPPLQCPLQPRQPYHLTAWQKQYNRYQFHPVPQLPAFSVIQTSLAVGRKQCPQLFYRILIMHRLMRFNELLSEPVRCWLHL